jgi:hypothetical protein
VASGEAGVEFVRTLSSLTGTDVAALDGQDGRGRGGRDWNLEYRTARSKRRASLHPVTAANRYLMQDFVSTTASETLTGTNSGDNYIFSTAGAATLSARPARPERAP